MSPRIHDSKSLNNVTVERDHACIRLCPSVTHVRLIKRATSCGVVDNWVVIMVLDMFDFMFCSGCFVAYAIVDWVLRKTNAFGWRNDPNVSFIAICQVGLDRFLTLLFTKGRYFFIHVLCNGE
jgi:hypothetical protein